MRKTWLIIFIIPFTACKFFRPSGGKDDNVVARVNDTYLYTDDLEGLVAPGTAPEDSIERVKGFIDEWVRQTLMLQKAELNLSSEMKSFEQQLENYRRTLIIYTYEQKLVSQLLDTVVTESQIQQYYQQNPSDFELRNNILKATYVVFSRKHPKRDKVKRWFLSEKEDHKKKLRKFCSESSLKYDLNDTTWMYFNDLEKDIPLKYSSQELFLSSRHFVQIEDSSLVYLLNIHDYKIKESLSPLEFEKSRIRSIILNIRKRELLHKAQDDIYQEAVEKKNL